MENMNIFQQFWFLNQITTHRQITVASQLVAAIKMVCHMMN